MVLVVAPFWLFDQRFLALLAFQYFRFFEVERSVTSFLRSLLQKCLLPESKIDLTMTLTRIFYYLLYFQHLVICFYLGILDEQSRAKSAENALVQYIQLLYVYLMTQMTIGYGFLLESSPALTQKALRSSTCTSWSS